MRDDKRKRERERENIKHLSARQSQKIVKRETTNSTLETFDKMSEKPLH